MDADVAIIGTGPGGGMAACTLAASGLKVIILEKSVLPRAKACGGAMPGGVRKIVPWDFGHLVEAEVAMIRNQFDHGRERWVHSPMPMLMVSRDRFDQHLVERAVATGRSAIDLREGFQVSRVTEDETGVWIAGPRGSTVRARYVIAADGAYSQTARSLGLKRGAAACAALDAEVEVDAENYEQEKGRATFNYFCLPHGYGWIFPKAGHLSCGVGAWSGQVKLREALDDFVRKSFPEGSVRSVRTSGHGIPLYSGAVEIATRRVCLVGDAANLVDPILGEGIRFALISGLIAAQVVTHALQPDAASSEAESWRSYRHADARDYAETIARVLEPPLDKLRRFILPVFLGAPEFFYEKFVQEGNSYIGLSEQLDLRIAASKTS